MIPQEAKAIFFDLIELPEPERETHLHNACAHDPELRTRVLALLRAHTDAGDFLGQVVDAGLTSIPGIDSDAEAPRPPEIIGPYKVIRTLGHGGFGTVYLCQQSEPIVRQIAVKVIRQGMDTKNILRRFEEERIQLSKMDHPGIARVLDAGRSEQGLPYIAMEYIEGERITDYCDRHRLDLGSRLRLFSQACMAVQHAHQKGVIHRDLKPSNVLVTEVDNKPVVKVIDFGVSKAVDERDGDDAITRTLQLVGTPQYMSPEQASTLDTDLDTRTDVYSLGVMLYELSTGSPPFDPEKLRSASVGQLERIIREIEPTRPSDKVERLDPDESDRVAVDRSTPISMIVRQLKGELDWVITCAMDKSRDRRYPSAFALYEDVHRILDGEMVHARPPSRIYAIRKLIVRNKPQTIAAALAVIGLLSVTGVSLISSVRIHAANSRIESTLHTQEQVLGFTEQMLGGIDPAVARGKDTDLFRMVLDRASERVDDELHGTPEVEVRVRVLIGEMYRSIGEFDQSIAQMQAAAGIALESMGKLHPQTIAARSALGAVHVELSEHEEARAILEDTYQDSLEVLGRMHPDTLVVLANLVTVYRAIGERDASASAAELLLSARIEILGDQHEDTMAARNTLALVLRSLGAHEQAKELFERVLAFQLEHLGEDHPNTLKTRTNLAQSYQELGMPEQAVRMNEAILEQKISVLGDTHPSVLVSMVNLAAVLQSTGEKQRAVDLLIRAHEISLATLGDSHQYTLTIRNNLGNYYAKNKAYEQALPWLRLACDGLRAQLGDRHPMTIKGQGNLIDVLIGLEGYPEALELSMQTRDLGYELFDPMDARLGMMNERVGICLLKLNRQDEARAYMSAAAQVYRDDPGPDSEQYKRLERWAQ